MTAIEKELQEAREMQSAMLGEHECATPICAECDDVTERIAQLVEVALLVADIAAMRIWTERTDECICCGDDSAIDRLIRRARALEGKS